MNSPSRKEPLEPNVFVSMSAIRLSRFVDPVNRVTEVVETKTLDCFDFVFKKIPSARINRMSPLEKKQCRRMTDIQKAQMWKFMDLHPELNSKKYDKEFTFEKARELWKEMGRILNSVPGPKKSWMVWKKVSQRKITQFPDVLIHSSFSVLA